MNPDDIQDETLIERHGYKRKNCEVTNIPLTLTQKQGRPIYHITDKELESVDKGLNVEKCEDVSLKCALKDILAIVYYNKLSIPSIMLYDGVVLVQWFDGYITNNHEVEITIKLGKDCTVVFWNERVTFRYPKEINNIYNKMMSSKRLHKK